METKDCPKCSEKIQSKAKKCKHCHADLRSWFVRHKILTGLLAFFVLVVALGTSGGPQPTVTIKEQPKETIQITARELYSNYSENEIAADALYKGKWLEVSGTLDNIGKDILDSMYVTLKTGDILGSVQCMLIDSELEKAANLNSGTQITVIGQNDGLMMNVLLDDCYIK